MRASRPPRSAAPPLASALAVLALAAALGGCGSAEETAVAAPEQRTVALTPLPQPTPTTRSPAERSPRPAPAERGRGATEPRAAAPPSSAPSSSQTQPAPAPAAASDSSAPSAAPRSIVHLKRPTALRARPGGPVVARLTPRTSFGSPTVLPVLRVSGEWLAVLSSELPNRRAGWISARAALEVHTTRYRIDVSLRHRRVVVRRDGRVVSRFPVAIGSPGTPTPQGRFAVTDKLLTNAPSSPYGCCILALSGHQTRTPQGWGGGDRIAIHATNLPETIGTEASLGCLRAPTAAIRRAVSTVPLGTIVTIRA